MKRLLLSIFMSVLMLGAIAQTSVNRTPQTKVSDALALMPAPNATEQSRLMGDLVSAGSQGVDMLTSMFDHTNNSAVSYALSGWASWVSKSATEGERITFVNGIFKGLETTQDPEIKAFYIRLLQICGRDESVIPVAAYVVDSRLASPAFATLVAIKTPQSQAIIIAIMEAAIYEDRVSKNLVAQAIGEANIKSPQVETTLISWVGSGDKNLDKSIFYALSRVGSVNSLPVLRNAAMGANYTADPTYANDDYMLLTKRLAADPATREIAVKEANNIIKKAAAKGAVHTKTGALEILTIANGKGSIPLIVKAMDDKNRAYRNSALIFTEPFADASTFTVLSAKLSRLAPEAKADVLNYLGTHDAKSGLPYILPLIDNSNEEVAIAAMWAAVRLESTSAPAAIVTRLKDVNSSAEIVAAAKAALLSFKGSVNDVVESAVTNGSVAGKVAALEILAARRATEKADAVIDATRSTDKNVSTAAYMALKNVVTVEEAEELNNMLLSASAENVTYVQQAGVAALRDLKPAEQVEAITYAMNNAGDKKSLYYVVLAGSGDNKVLSIISEGFKKGNSQEKAQALSALMAWKGMEATDDLLTIAKSGDDTFSDRALTAYVSRAASSKYTPEMKLIMLAEALEIATTPAQKRNIMREVERTQTFQALILAGKYLEDQSPELRQNAVMAVMNIGLAHKDFYGPVVVELLNKAAIANQGRDKEYQKEEIRKHIEALPKDGGYVSLFNGKDLTGWKGLVENPIKRAAMTPEVLAQKQIVADQLMRRDWTVNNGLLEFTGKGYDNICTEKLYGDFEMYIDWKLYAEGDEADAGIYLRGTPQVQMWDTARRNVGAQVGSGGLYNNSINPKNPLKVADNKLGSWNSFYIKMVGDRVTVILNGELVTDNVILENYWNRRMPIFPMEQLELQAHGTRVAYRNIYVNELPRVEPTLLSAEEQKDGFEMLFDGTNMSEWRGNTRDYIMEDGNIVLRPINGGGGNLYTKKQYADFVFRFEFMLTPGANNGLGIRTPLTGDAAYVGMELQILDNEDPIYTKLEEYQYHGSVYGVLTAKRGFLKPIGEWNYEEVIVKGDNIKVILNGTTILDGNIAEARKNGALDKKEHPGLSNTTGHIAFLGHGSIVKFRNVRVKELK